jgi:4-hydroxy 2-oxovalerate aldolase
MIDASVYGIGRGAGNLNLEVIADFLNKHYKKNYNIRPMLEIFEKYIKDIYRQKQWGFSPATYSTGRHNCNPNYADYFDSELKLPPSEIDAVLQTLAPEDKIRFFPEIADKALKSYLQSRCNG